ncbi:MAG: SRPBCC family protein [Pseudomonadales bacterium]|jgi:uncharacterized protein YndB with AHSA1/START domain
MAERDAEVAQGEYVFVEIIHADREAVWQALTSPEFTEQYWHATRVRARWEVGAPIEFLVDGDEVGCVGEILEMERPARLSYTWRFPRNPLVRDEAPSRVTFLLETIGSPHAGTATRLTVHHDRFPPGSRMPEMVVPGWPLVLAGLKTLLETGRAVDYSSMT